MSLVSIITAIWGEEAQKGWVIYRRAHSLEMPKPEFKPGRSAFSIWAPHLLTYCFSCKTGCLSVQTIASFSASQYKRPLHLAGDSQKGSGLKCGFFPAPRKRAKASLCLRGEGSRARRLAAQDHTWLCSASRQVRPCPRSPTAPASNRPSIKERRVP